MIDPTEVMESRADLRAATVLRKTVVVEGRRLSYLTTDDGLQTRPTLLLIHGAGVSARTWVLQLRGLSAVARPVALDLPGHGESESFGTPTLDVHARAARAVLEHLACGPAFVAGHSLGAGVALTLASTAAELVRGLVIVSGCARLPGSHPAAAAFASLLPEPLRGMLFLAAAKRFLFAPGATPGAVRLGMEEIRGCPPAVVRADVTIARAMDLEALAAGLRIPALVLCGVEDRLTPVSLSRQLWRLVAHSRLVEVRGAGHMLPLEAAQRVNDEIVRFIHRVEESESEPGVLSAPMRRGLIERAMAWLRRRANGRSRTP